MSPIAAANRDETDENLKNVVRLWNWMAVMKLLIVKKISKIIDYYHSSTICHNCKEKFWEHEEYEACPACSYVWCQVLHQLYDTTTRACDVLKG